MSEPTSDNDRPAGAANPASRPSPSPVDPTVSNPMARSGLDPDATAQLPVVADPPAPPVDDSTPPIAPRPAPGPRHAAPDAPDPGRHPRRWFLAGAGVAVLAGAGGVGGALLRSEPTPKPNPAPPALLGAIAAEQALLADLDATTGGTPQVRVVLASARADHAAHLQALRQVAASYDPAKARSAPAGRPRSAAELRAAEASAATFAASRAELLDKDVATLLASIAACEASHAELLR